MALSSSWQPNAMALTRGAVHLGIQSPRYYCGADGCSALLGGPPSGTLAGMTIKARVSAGRLVVDEPTDLPDGTELELLPLDPGDWLNDADRTALHKALRESNADVAVGRLVDADEILRELRSR